MRHDSWAPWWLAARTTHTAPTHLCWKKDLGCHAAYERMLLEGVHQRVRHGRATHTNNCAALCALWSVMCVCHTHGDV
jgi:hypothetical protein